MAKPFASSFYKSKIWRQQREYVLRRDNFTCQLCGARAHEIHHIIPLTPSNVDNYDISLGLDNLQSLCHSCHQLIDSDLDVPAGYMFDESGQVVPINNKQLDSV